MKNRPVGFQSLARFLFLTIFLALTGLVSAQNAIFSADFESAGGDNNWTVNPFGSDTASLGLWSRGNPEGTTYQLGNTPSGQNALVTDPTGGNDFGFDIDGGLTSVLSPPIALPAAFDSNLSFRYYFNRNQISNVNDFFRVSVRGTTNTTILNFQGNSNPRITNNYTSFSFDLTPFAGQTVQIFVEAAAPNAILAEASVDDVIVTTTAQKISGQVRYDIDGDGDLANTATEDRAAPGVTLELFAADGAGAPTGPVLASTTSASDGAFHLFTDQTGDFVVVSTNFISTTSTADSGGANDDRVPVTVTAGNNLSGLLFLDTFNNVGITETVATYYLPYEEDDILTALDTIENDANDPIRSYNSISVIFPNTVILYDHWEDNGVDGYEVFRNSPAQPLTEVWGDGNPLNGFAPGHPDDLLEPGDVILLDDVIPSTPRGPGVYFDARDKISTARYVAITRASWASGSSTLLAGAWELFPTTFWGVNFVLPVGEDLPDGVDGMVFEYTGASIMSSLDNNEIRFNGTLLATIDEGETYTWNGTLNTGDMITSTRPSQVHLITGDIGDTYESRWYTLPPSTQESNAYVAPTSTPVGDDTLVWLYSNNSTPVIIDIEYSDSPATSITLPGGSNAVNRVASTALINGEAARFSSRNGETFFAIATVDSGGNGVNNGTTTSNNTHDWGFSLVPENFLTPTAVAGLAPGADPTDGAPGENSAPLWVSAVFPRDSDNFALNHDSDPNNDVQITLCIDYGGNGNVDGLSTGGFDLVAGLGYDRQITIDELDQEIIYVDLDDDGIPDEGANQTGTRVWVCDQSDALIAMAYGQDPNTASAGSPAVDLGTTIPGIPILSLAKDALQVIDTNGNGFPDIGDQLRYNIVVENSGNAPFAPNTVDIVDELNSFISYVPGSTEVQVGPNTTPIPDNGAGTPFPLDSDSGGYVFPQNLNPLAQIRITFLADIVSFPADGTGTIINVASGTAPGQFFPVQTPAQISFKTGTIAGTVFEDTTGNGNGDTPIDFVQITLLNADGSLVDFDPLTPIIEPYTVTTFNGGEYEFPNLPLGDYFVSQSQPAGLDSVSDGDSTLPGDEADTTGPNDNRIFVTILADEVDDGNDFIEKQPDPTLGNIAGTVFRDNNNDDIGDAGLAGVTLTLRDSGGAVVATTISGTDGTYIFTGLTPGNYEVTQTQPADFLSVSDTDGLNNNVIGDQTPISVTAGATNSGNDFVEEQRASISGLVFFDNNGDGISDGPIAGVEIQLQNLNGDVLATRMTTNTGAYSFEGVEPGTYRVVQLQPAGFDSISDVDGANDNIIGSENPIVLNAGDISRRNNFVERQLSSISGNVSFDTEADGTLDGPINEVPLELRLSDGTFVASTTTDPSGNYTFGDLQPGSYQVVQTQPDGFTSLSDTDGANNNVIGDESPIVLTAGVNSVDNDFIEQPNGSISGTVLADTDNDGDGDQAIPTVTLTLLDTNGDPVTFDVDPNTAGVQNSVTTDNTGAYSFTNVPPGSYQVQQTQPVGFLSVSDVDGGDLDLIGDVTQVGVTAGQNTPNQNFVEEQPGSISGTVLADTDNDGDGDQAIPTVTLTLLDTNGDPVTFDVDPNTAGVQNSVTTSNTGAYSFANVPPGSYQVQQTQPANFLSVSDVDGGDLDLIGDVTQVGVIAGQDTPNQNFVEEQPGSISGTVLADTDNDGDGDQAIPTVTLTLLDTNGDPVTFDVDPTIAGVQNSVTTSNTGAYRFENVPPGNYQIQESQPADFFSVSDVDGGDLDLIGDVTQVGVTAGQNTPNQNFIEEEEGSLSGFILIDTNNNGQPNNLLLNTSVTLTLFDSNGDEVATTTTTDGNYSFDGLVPGNYRVVQTQPDGFLSVNDTDGANNNVIGDETPIAVVAGQNTPGNNFLEEQPGSISGTVLADANNDGVGTEAISGVTLTLLDSAGVPVTFDVDPTTAGVQNSVTTDGTGAYSFANVPPGDYQIQESQPVGFLSVSDVDGGDLDLIGDVTQVGVTAGQDTPNQNFVEEEPGSISGTVLADANNDGVGTEAISGVTLTLLDSAGVPVTFDVDPNTAGVQNSVTTDNTGAYSFTNVPPGDYQVQETQPVGFLSVSDVDGGDLDLIGDVTQVGVTAGQDTPNQNFVEEQPGSISGTVLADTDNDGDGDQAIPTVTLTLLDTNGDPVTFDVDPTTAGVQNSVTTSNTGAYRFENVPPGNYQIQESQPADFFSVSDVDGGDLDLIGDVAQVGVTAGQNTPNQNFIEEEEGSLSGFILIDTNNNGQPNNLLLNTSVTLTLFDSNGDEVATTTTTDGNYSFDGLVPGNYRVVQTQPDGFLSVNDTDGANNNVIGDETPIAVVAGQNTPGNNFLEEAAGTISGVVQNDTDGDTIGNVGIDDVVLELQLPDGTPVDLDPDSAGVQSTVMTEPDGSYSFENVPPGDYVVVQTQPTGLASVIDIDTDQAGEAADDAANGDPLDNQIPVTLTTGETDSNNNFTEGALIGAGNLVFTDVNGDGVYTEGTDTPTAGVSVALYRDNGDGVFDINTDTLVGTDTTDSEGSFLVTGSVNASSSNYFVHLPAGNFAGGVLDGQVSAPGADANAAGDDGAGENGIDNPNAAFEGVTSGLISLVPGSVPTGETSGNPDATNPEPDGSIDATIDFAFLTPGAINGVVQEDTTGDGVGDQALASTLTIYLDVDGDGLFDPNVDTAVDDPNQAGVQDYTTTSSAVDGTYSFGGLPPGNYIVVQTQPPGLASVIDSDADPDGIADDQPNSLNFDNVIPVTLVAGETDSGNNFTEGQPIGVGNLVYLDTNGDGLYTEGTDNPQPGVLVELYANIGPNQVLVGQATTDGEGGYTLTTASLNAITDYTVVVAASNFQSGGVLEGSISALAEDAAALDDDEAGGDNGINDPDPATNGISTTVTLVAGSAPTNETSGNPDLTNPTPDANFDATVDFAFVAASSIGDFVFNDLDGDGIQDLGELGLANVVVKLLDENGNELARTTTDANGAYSFDNLLAGDYRVAFERPSGFSASPQGAGGDSDLDSNADPVTGVSDLITLTAGTPIDDVDAGFFQGGTIGNLVWLDEDGSGMQEPGEPGLPGVTVNLLDDNGVIVATTTTDADGGYLFTDIPVGDYQVQIVPDAGLNSTFDPDGAGDPFLSGTVSVTPGSEDLAQNFGLNHNTLAETNTPSQNDPGALGDRIWNDANGNGLQDPGESGIANVTVTLGSDTTGDGMIDTTVTTTTDACGNYLFDGLTPGAYFVTVDDSTLPAGSTQTGDPDGTLDDATTSPIIVGPGDVVLTADFGYQPATGFSIGQTIYFDADGDGTQDVNEPGIPGVTIELLDSNGDVIATTTTDSMGGYQFPGLPDGDYTVNITDTDNLLGDFQATEDSDGLTTPLTSTVTLNGADDFDQNFGFTTPGQDAGEGVIGDTIFLDRDNDGLPDAGEGLENVTVELRDSNGIIVATALTDANGTYSFGNLPLGDYTVNVLPATLPAGVTNTTFPAGGAVNTSTITLNAANPVNLDQDFGYQGTNSLGGTLFTDTNADGTFAGESGIAGVTVALLDGNGNVVGSTTTGVNGDYSFDNLPDGTFTVQITDEANLLDGFWQSDGPNDGTDNNSQPSGYQVTLGGGQTDTTSDFGFYQEGASIGDLVFNDSDGDGSLTGEAGIPGVPVTLTITYPTAGGDTVTTVTTITDANGNYSFDNLLLDEDNASTTGGPSFEVSFATPAGFEPTAANVGNDELDSDGASVVVSDLVQGESDTKYDSGFRALAAITGTVELDTDGDGTPDGGLENVTLQLQLPDGTPVTFDVDPNTPGIQNTVTTDINGDYIFTNVPPGNYQVVQTQPEDTVSVSDSSDIDGADGANTDPLDNIIPVSVINGETDSGNDFLEETAYSVGNLVYIDEDRDGTFSTGDTRVPGASLSIFLASDLNTEIATVPTDAQGNFLFENLAPGDYVIRVNSSNFQAGNDLEGLNAFDTNDGDSGSDDDAGQNGIVSQSPDSLGVLSNVFTLGGNTEPSATETGDKGISDDATDNIVDLTIDFGFSTVEVVPQGYFYLVGTGEILPGGSIRVISPGDTPPAGQSSSNILFIDGKDGADGSFQWIPTDNTEGLYCIEVTPPIGYIVDPNSPVAGASYDPPQGSSSVALGQPEDPSNSGFLQAGASGDSGAPTDNPYYLKFDLSAGDPLVTLSNIPLVKQPLGSYQEWVDTFGRLLIDKSLTGDGDGDGISNFAEYALCFKPDTGLKVFPDGSPNPGYVLEFNDTTMVLDSSFIRPAGVPDGSNGETEFVTYTLQKSVDGQTWIDVPASEITPVISLLPNGAEKVTFPNVESLTVGGAPAQLTRVLVTYNDTNANPVVMESYLTGVQGWHDHVVNPLCETFSNPFNESCLFLGTIPGDFAGGFTLDLADSVGSEDMSAFLDLANHKYYIEILDGPREGEILDLASVTATEATIVNDTDLFLGPDYSTWLGALDATFAGSRILIREHKTVADLFPTDAYLAGTTPTDSARILLLDRNTGLVETLFLVDAPGTNPDFWSPTVGGLSNENDRVIPPTQGTFSHNFRTADAFDQLLFGEVRTNKLNVPLKEGYNLVPSVFPIDQSPLDRAMTPANGFTGSNNRAFADQILNWSADALPPILPSNGDTVPTVFQYDSVFLLEIGTFFQWNNGDDVNDFTDRSNDLLFKKDRAVMINIYADPDEMPNSDMPDYFVPSSIDSTL